MHVLHRFLPMVTLLVVLVLSGSGCEGDCPSAPAADSGPVLDQGPALDGRADLARKDASPPAGWAISAGESGTDGILNILVDASGNLVVSGSFAGTVSFGSTKLTASGESSFVGKLDKTGKWLWAVALDGVPTVKNQDLDGLAVDASGNIYYAGQFTGSAKFGSTTLTSKGDEDIFVVKLDSSGKVLWAVSAGGTGEDFAEALVVGSDGKITLCGDFAGTASFGTQSLTASGVADLFVARLEANGSFVWAVRAGSDSTEFPDRALGLALHSSGNLYVSGRAGPGASFGTQSLTGQAGSTSAYVAKLDATGKFLWVTAPPAATHNGRVALGPAGSVYLSSDILLSSEGSGVGIALAVVSKLSDSGALEWSTMIASDRTAWANNLLVDSKGDVTLAGYFRGTVLLGSKIFTSKGTGVTPLLVRLDSAGKVTGGEQIPTTGWGAAVGLARDTSGNTYVAGIFNGTATFGGTSLTSKGPGSASDAFLWNRGPDQP